MTLALALLLTPAGAISCGEVYKELIHPCHNYQLYLGAGHRRYLLHLLRPGPEGPQDTAHRDQVLGNELKLVYT